MCMVTPRERGISFDVLDEMAQEVRLVDHRTFLHFQACHPARRASTQAMLRVADLELLRPRANSKSSQSSSEPTTASSKDLGERRQKKRSRRRKPGPAALEHEITLMLKHLPLALTPGELFELFPDEVLSYIDFFYLPTHFETKLNLGYAFVNFVDREAAALFAEHWERSEVPERSDAVQPARVQGFEANVDRFRHSSVRAVLPTDLQPRIFQNGEPVPFPAPDRPLPGVGPRFRPTDAAHA